MTKQEFLDNLRRALTGKVDSYKANDTIQYYSDYIEREIRSGKTEEEVIASLGDPRLLVRTMISAENAAGEFQGSPTTREYTQYENVGDESRNTGKIYSTNKLGWLLVIIAVLAILTLVMVFRVVMFFLPVLLPAILIVVIIRYFSKR